VGGGQVEVKPWESSKWGVGVVRGRVRTGELMAEMSGVGKHGVGSGWLKG
jgi:hypothetical protein